MSTVQAGNCWNCSDILNSAQCVRMLTQLMAAVLGATTNAQSAQSIVLDWESIIAHKAHSVYITTPVSTDESACTQVRFTLACSSYTNSLTCRFAITDC